MLQLSRAISALSVACQLSAAITAIVADLLHDPMQLANVLRCCLTCQQAILGLASQSRRVLGA